MLYGATKDDRCGLDNRDSFERSIEEFGDEN